MFGLQTPLEDMAVLLCWAFYYITWSHCILNFFFSVSFDTILNQLPERISKYKKPSWDRESSKKIEESS